VPISHATAVLKWGEATVYTDPVGEASSFRGQPSPDIILLTDIHADHFSTSTLAAVSGDAALIVPQAVMDKLPESLASKAMVLNNGQNLTEQGFRIEAVPMYNYPESADSRHVKGRGNGYIVERDGFRLYVAGDTAGTPEMRALKDIDMAFVPMNLPFTMGVEEAADAVLAFKPKQVYPYHYRGQDGLADVGKFKQLVNAADPNIEVVLVDWYPER
ncbi:MAG TPA: MBL fold metallo-hydrolase, partial [Candidatus Paceibacterota bacterium]|nr:MBL fold metallo-hydrolase [Candidatus Paceibacterota bacterium]